MTASTPGPMTPAPFPERRLFLPVRLAARLHVDLLRMSSALCRG